MGETERERELLKETLTEVHRATRERTPPFELLWARAVARMGAPAATPKTARRTRLAVAAAAVTTLVLATALLLWRSGDPSRGELHRAMTIAAEIGEWRAPLDFLLQTPGREWLDSPPRWDPAAAAVLSLVPDLAETHSPLPDSLEEVPR